MRLIGAEIEQIQQDTAKVIYLAVPTFGQVSIEWHTHMMLLQNPLNKSVFHGCVRGTEVGTARNILVDQALHYRHPGGLTVSHVFFVDDDTLIPPYALTRLLSHKRPIVSGLYFAKTDVPQPLMLKDELSGLVESWTPGELVECDGHGMGCTLIEMRVFRDIAEKGLVGTEQWHGRDIWQFFKTTRDDVFLEHGVPKVLNQTEDMYFLHRAKRLGYQPCVDTGCFAWHWDEGKKTAFPLEQWQEFRTKGTVTWPQTAGVARV